MYDDVLPAYDPKAAQRLEKLCDSFKGVARLYKACAHPDKALTGELVVLPWNIVQTHGPSIRRAFLASCETLADFQKAVEAGREDPVRERFKAELRDAYRRRELMPYPKAVTSYPGAFHDLDNVAFCLYTYNDYRPRSWDKMAEKTTLIAVEIKDDRVNICLARTAENNLFPQVEQVADDFYHRHLRKLNFAPGTGVQGKPVHVYMHTPVECAMHGKDDFVLVRDGQMMPMQSLPRAMDLGVLIGHEHLTRRITLNTTYNDFRGFSLRAM